MKHLTKICAGLCLGLLAACSGGEDSSNSQTAVLKELRTVVKENRKSRKAPATKFQITRAILDLQTVGSLEVTVESTNQTAYLIPGAFRTDHLPGKIAVWRTITGENVVLRDGVLISTRGLGRDLASSDASASLRAIKARGNGGGERRMQVRNDVNGAFDLLLQCESAVVGNESIDIIELRFQTLHLRETCQSTLGTVRNDYWVNQSGKVLQSRQWAGPDLGYLKIRLLK